MDGWSSPHSSDPPRAPAVKEEEKVNLARNFGDVEIRNIMELKEKRLDKK